MLELIIVSQILGCVACLALFIWTCRYCYRLYSNKKLMNEIKKKQSRTSVLKLMLKARLNRNSNSLAKTFNGEAILINMFQEKYTQLVGYDLSVQEHYQKIISTLKEVANESDAFFSRKQRVTSSLSEAESEKKSKTENKDPKVLEYERLIEFELGCLLMIKEIIITQDANRILIEDYNQMQDKKREMIKMPSEMTVEDRDLLFGMLELEFVKKKSDKSGKNVAGVEVDGPDQIHLDLEETKGKSA